MTISSNTAQFTQRKTGLTSLTFIQVFCTLGYALLTSTLVLYTTYALGFKEDDAKMLIAGFSAINFGSHIIGGYLGGRVVSNRSLFMFGMVLQVIGSLILSHNMTTLGLYWGIAFFLTGCGVNVSCINMILTQRFHPDDHNRETAFLWNYAGMNAGFFIGYALAGYYQLSQNYHAIFQWAAVGNVLAIIIALICWKSINEIDSPITKLPKTLKRKRYLIGFAFIVLMVPLFRILISYVSQANYTVLTIGTLLFFCILIATTRNRQKFERYRLYAYLLLAIGSIIFFSMYSLAPNGLALFVDNNIDLNVLGIRMTPQWVQNINPVIIVFGGPFMGWLLQKARNRGINLDIPVLFTLAMFFIALGMLAIPAGIVFANEQGLVAFHWIVWSYVFQSIGELCISPIGYALVGKLVPKRHQGILMGYWMMLAGLANVLAGFISRAMPDTQGTNPVMTNPQFSEVFIWLGCSALIAGVIFLVLIPKLRFLMSYQNKPSVLEPKVGEKTN